MVRMKRSRKLRFFNLVVLLLISFWHSALCLSDTVETKYQNGNVRSRGLMLDGVREGIWKSYYPEGQLSAVEEYSNGNLSGSITYYYPSGGIRSNENWESGYQEGEANYYFENGRIYRKGPFSQGMYEGRWLTYHENGKLRQEGVYVQGFPAGEWKFYSESGELIKSEIFPDQYDPAWDSVTMVTFYFPNGTKMMEGPMKNGEEQGTWILYKKNGKEKERIDY